MGFDLLEVHTINDVYAIQTIILSNFETNEIYHSDFWIGGTAQWSDINGLQWMWNRRVSLTGREIDNFFWENDKEEQFMNYENKCIKITRNSWYKQWKATSCLESNRIICEKDINKEIEDTYSYIQCQCNDGYSGIFCNKTSVDFHTIDQFLCNKDRLFLACPINTLIYIDYAQFGIFNEGIGSCNDTNMERDMIFNCTDPFSLQTLKLACEGRQLCDLRDIDSIFDYSICSKNSFSGLKYRMECVDKNLFTICPDDFILIDDKCIRIFLNTKKTWFESRKICNSMESDLIEPITTEKTRKYINTQTSLSTSNTVYFWHLGYLSNFLQNNNSCPMLTFNLNPTNELNIGILSCNEKINFICQKPPTTIFDQERKIDDVVKGSLNQQVKVPHVVSSSSTSKCPSITWFSLKFNETNMCTYSTAPCGSNGQLAYLKCGCSNNEWDGLPNTKMCVHNFFSDIDKEILLNGDINYISDYLYNNLKNYTFNGELYAGDLIEGIHAINKLIDYNDKKTKKNIANDISIFIQNIAKSGDTILSKDNRDNWNLWNDGGIKGNISLLMTLMEKLIHSPNIKNEFSMNQSQLSNWEFLYIPDYKDINITINNRALFTSEVETKFPYIQLPSINDIEDTNKLQQYGRDFFKNTTKEISVAYYVYKNIYWLLKPNSTKLLNSHVIGTTVNSPNDNIYFKNNSTVKIILNHMRKNNIDNVTCVYWDKDKLTWSDNGCYVHETNTDYTICACNHLTNFAILIDIIGDELITLNQEASDALELISIFGCALSVLFLFVSILIFQCLPSIHSERVYIHRNLCITLLAAELTFIIGIHRTSSYSGCKTVAILLHYLFLSSFCWMLVEGCELYRLLIKVFEPDESHMNYYYLFSLLFPGIIVGFSGGFGWKHYGTYKYCWIDTSSGFIWAFVGPIIIVVIVNIFILFIALKVVLSVRSRDRKTGSKIMGWIKGSSTLLCLLGITWVFGFLSAIKSVEPIFTFIFTILNSLQGIFIFIFHILLNEKIQKALIKSSIRMSSIFRKPKISSMDNGTNSNNTIMSHNNKISQTKETTLSLWQKIKLSLNSEIEEDGDGTIYNSIDQIPSNTITSSKNSLNVSLQNINDHSNSIINNY
uniref:EGF-like domain-containing protein n=1 Tax=Strongyloides papillosus TaxID=174720 RepID=A0A0N5C4T4_STREA